MQFFCFVVTAIDGYTRTACCINCCASVRYECTVLNCYIRTVSSGDNFNVFTVTGCKHCTVTRDSYYCIILNPKNFNDFSIKRCINRLSVKIKSYCNTINYNCFCKSNISKNNYCATVSRVNRILKCCVFISVHFSHSIGIQTICSNSKICCCTVCFKNDYITCKSTAVNGKLTYFTLKSVYSTTRNSCHTFSACTACSIDISYVTATDVNSACSGRCGRN